MAEHSVKKDYSTWYQTSRLDQSKYIIAEPEHYKIAIPNYATGFINEALRAARGGSHRYSKRAGLSNMKLMAQNGFKSVESTINTINSLESQFAQAFETSAPVGVTNSLASTAKTARQSISRGGDLDRDDSKSQIFLRDLDNYISYFIAGLDSIGASAETKRAFGFMREAWGRHEMVSTAAYEISEKDLMAMEFIAKKLNDITEKYNEFFSKYSDEREATIRTASSLHSILSQLMGKFGEWSVPTSFERGVSRMVNQDLKVIGQKNKFKMTGTLVTDKGYTGKVDAIVGPMYIISKQENGDTLTAKASFQLSVKQSGSLSGFNKKTAQNYAGKGIKVQETQAQVLNYLHTMSPTSFFYASNVLTHDKSTSSEAKTLVKQGIAAHMFDTWLAGTGKRLSDRSTIDLANYLFVNGHLFAMTDIIQAVAESFAQQGRSLNSDIQVSLSKNNIKNDKVNEEIRSYAEGFRRSGTVKGELADIKLIARLNPSVLLKVAQKYGVRDLTL